MTRRATKQSRKSHTKPIAAFGAAMTTLAVTQAPPAQAAIINLSFNPKTVPYSAKLSVSLYGPGNTNVFNFKVSNTSSGQNLGAFLYTTGFSNWAKPDTKASPVPFPGPFNGTYTFAFQTANVELGWVRVLFTGPQKDIYVLAAAYNDTPGEPIHIGTGAPTVPEPASVTLAALGALAAGANEVRRRRRERVASA